MTKHYRVVLDVTMREAYYLTADDEDDAVRQAKNLAGGLDQKVITVTEDNGDTY